MPSAAEEKECVALCDKSGEARAPLIPTTEIGETHLTISLLLIRFKRLQASAKTHVLRRPCDVVPARWGQAMIGG